VHNLGKEGKPEKKSKEGQWKKAHNGDFGKFKTGIGTLFLLCEE